MIYRTIFFKLLNHTLKNTSYHSYSCQIGQKVLVMLFMSCFLIVPIDVAFAYVQELQR